MKVILSRKGFDSGYGGYPSPILPDGRLISLPIPSEDSVAYSALILEDGKSYFDLMKGLHPTIKYDGGWHRLTKQTKCHLDPDIYRDVKQRENHWLPIFGQINQAQTHLRNQGVKENDIFLFFGWFRKTRLNGDELLFDYQAPDLHVIFGYLQIGSVKKADNCCEIPAWMRQHPHASGDRRKNFTNTIYVARDKSSWNSDSPGSGVFRFQEELVLTKQGCSRSKWQLPEFFRGVKISRHSVDSWKKEGYFKSVDIGQEFVIEENKKVEEWAIRLIEESHLQ